MLRGIRFRNGSSTLTKKASIIGNTYVALTTSDTVFIFVHGLLSSASKCWSNDNGQFWPQLVADDPAFDSPSVFVAEYHTSISSGVYDIGQCVAEVRRSLELPHGAQRSPLSHTNIVFVCHSLGGVVCRRLLEEYQDSFKGKHIGIVLMASPSLGSRYAKRLQRIARLYGHKIAHDLMPSSDSLRDIDDRFRTLVQRNGFLSLTGTEAVEHHGPFLIRALAWALPPVVEMHSASRYFGRTVILPGTDHFSIVKPHSETADAHRLLSAYYIENIRPKVKLNVAGAVAEVRNEPADPLFEVYRSCHRSFYIERKVDLDVRSILSQSSVWISGKSGVGKTSLAKRWILEQGMRPVEIPLGHISAKNGSIDLTTEIMQSLQAGGVTPIGTGFAGLVDAIAALSNHSAVPIFVDEVPIEEKAEETAVASFFGSLLDAAKRKGSDRIRFIICSINPPETYRLPEKMREQYRFVALEPWSTEELLNLYAIIQRQLGLGSSIEAFRPTVAKRACGSPRFIKTFFRHVESSRDDKHFSLDIALARTSETIGGNP